MSGIRGEVRPHDAASGENRRRNAETGHQPLGLVTEIDAADRYQVAVTSQQHQSLPKCELFAAPISNGRRLLAVLIALKDLSSTVKTRPGILMRVVHSTDPETGCAWSPTSLRSAMRVNNLLGAHK